MRWLLLILCLWPLPRAEAEVIRIALFNTELARKGPGLLLRDITRDQAQVRAVRQILERAQADAVLLLRFDWDLETRALQAFADTLAHSGLSYPHRFALRPNTGRPSGHDLDGDGKTGTPRDAQGYGLFAGQNGMALLSRFPIDHDRVRDFSALLWRDLPGAQMPQHRDGTPFPSLEAQSVQRLSAVAHWDIPLLVPGGAQLNLLAFHASPPVFDGPEDANGRRNGDELSFWRHYLDGELDGPAPQNPVIVIGGGNIDPVRGEGHHDRIRALINHPRLQDPRPQTDGPVPEATVDWSGITAPPLLRVDYILPDAGLEVMASGLIWPDPYKGSEKLRHALVWVDIRLP